MSQNDFEKNNETQGETEKPPSTPMETNNKPIQINESHIRKLELITTQIGSFEENARKALEVIDEKVFSGKLGNLKKLEESTRITLKIIEESTKHKVVDTDASKILKELESSYLDLDQEIRDISNVSIVSQGVLLDDVDNRVNNLIQTQHAYLQSLEGELREKEEMLKQLRMLLEQQHK